MVQILHVSAKPKIAVRLRKLDKTTSCWLFTFSDVVNRFEQRVLLPFDAPWDAAEYMWEQVHAKFLEEARKKQWLQK